MNINRNNYESFFLDYFDRNLNSEQEEQLFVFLSNNIDLKFEFDDFENFSICEEENFIFPNKKDLKKELISKDKFSEYCIDKVEGKFSPNQEKNFKDFFKINPECKKDYEFYKKTILQPDLSVNFDEKQELKKIDFNLDFDQASVACLENDLSLSEKNRFEKFLKQNSQKHKEYLQYKKTILKSDKSIVFENKILLKKYIASKTNNIKTIISYASAAAAIVLFFFGFNYYQDLLKTETVAMSKIDSTETRVSFSNSAAFLNPPEKQKKLFDAKNYGSKQYKKMIKEQTEDHKKNEREIIKPIKSLQDVRFANNYKKSSAIKPKLYKIIRTYPKKYNTISDAITQKITEKIIKPENVSKTINFWDIAQAGIRTFNNLTGSKIELKKQSVNNGKSQVLAVYSKNFNFSTKIKKTK
ncbi:MAG: hypothetical protein IMY72_08000 [Bacteroidetes bacterium]|nr:hypothetical protein [Bacteroidota bacterium]